MKLYFKNKSKIQSFSDKNEWRDSLSADLHQENYGREFFKQRENYLRWKHGNAGRSKGAWKEKICRQI